ncbi:MAG: hypothetical protein FWC91_13155 [Defluviitaleaceae bacterium]|nr:hypothetical protein [Defluviitaleaceae bacterium]
MIQHPITHLTHNYRQDKNSNNYKLLDLGHQEHLQIQKTLRLIELWRDMDEAEGLTLDRIGKNVLELREGRNDVEFRKAIKIKIRGNLSVGTIDDLNAIAYALFGGSFRSVDETWHQSQYGYEPAGLVLSASYDPSLQGLFLRYQDLLMAATAGGVGLSLVIRVGPLVFVTSNTFNFVDLNIRLGVWNITRPRGPRWNGHIKFNGEYRWGADIIRYGIQMPLLEMDSYKVQNNNVVSTQELTINLSVSYKQPGLSGSLITTLHWNGMTRFNGEHKWNGIYSQEEL